MVEVTPHHGHDSWCSVLSFLIRSADPDHFRSRTHPSSINKSYVDAGLSKMVEKTFICHGRLMKLLRINSPR